MKKIIFTAVLVTFGLGSSAVATECNVEAGKGAFQKCVACHHVELDKGHFVGPNLNKVIGREVGSAKGFKFSRQLRKDERAWNQSLFDEFITEPAAIFPRTRMAFGGIKNPQERKDLFCFLQQLSEGKK